MKIAIDCRMLGMSGIGIFLENLLNNLPNEHEYILIGNKDMLVHCNANIQKIIDCSIPIFSYKEILSYPVSFVNKCDAFFIPNWNIPAGIKIPIFSMIHDVVFLDMPDITSPLGKIIRYIWLLRTVIISRHIFTVSYFSCQRIAYYFRHKYKISVVYNDVLPKVKSYYTLYNKERKNYYMYIGNIKKHKGLNVLISAYENLNDGNSLLIVGKKENFHTFDNIYTKNKNIVFTGYIKEKELYEFLYNAKALIQPSLYEGFGIPPLEALWLKTPVILSDIPVFKEIYHDMPVIFFKSGDSIDLAEKIKNINYFDYNPDILLKKYDALKTANTIFYVIKTGI
jgi:glycosyltransferase involved in cell wall biosynthesis